MQMFPKLETFMQEREIVLIFIFYLRYKYYKVCLVSTVDVFTFWNVTVKGTLN